MPQRTLALLSLSAPHAFQIPSKKINEGEDVSFWLTTYAYTDLMTFLLQLNASMFPQKINTAPGYRAWTLNASDIIYSTAVTNIQTLISKLSAILDEAPPDPGPRRFGNVSFRKWYAFVEERIDTLLEEHLPSQVLSFPSPGDCSPKDELKHYLLGSFGSPQRLDYGTGHELSFVAFLGGIWKLGGFTSEQEEWGNEERGIVLGIIEPYLNLIRKIILTYTLEPAGSHGVWGLDDHSFISYIFGSAQYSPAIITPQDIPTEGSIPDAPRPGDVTKSTTISRERKTNMYFSAIGFIYDVKSGPFWEHSPILFDISGVTAGWAKINKGMIKMYNAEVLGKFPVVQHFPFGSLFRWEKNPDAVLVGLSTHMTSQPSRQAVVPPLTLRPGAVGMPVSVESGMQAPWATKPEQRTSALPGPKTSWTGQSSAPGLPETRAPWASTTPRVPPQGGIMGGGGNPGKSSGRSDIGSAAPWAKGDATKRHGPGKSDESGP